MRTVTWVLFWLLPLAAFASKKDTADYVDGVLLSFHTIRTGSSCSGSGTVNAQADDNGSVRGSTSDSSDCSDNFTRFYSVQIGSQVMTVTRAISGGRKAAAIGTLGWSAVFMHQSVLANQLPGTHFLAYSDGKYVHIKIGKKETIFNIVDAK